MTFSLGLNLDRQPRRPRMRHQISWYIYDEVEFELECLHEPLEDPHTICDGELARDEPGVFIEGFAGDRAPLRNGIIESWWTGCGEDCELSWKYVDEPNAEQR